ncbi:hypothetical protein [Crocosphaera watsonii]|uniref:Uncharacterized protein n=3 Tax=Crocosphaera watsonii TaxID=263511 RepID=T2JSW3_CROWT|nr:hypothetical protein [Crocosphaera watsonii]EHJ15068.1 hypothetical protein CWATWH0003_0271 [Crocosphaera watsonii WH 0003]CCQ59220.1 hypothetical protein CWATWH0005_3577 [Crocosphaera watsonii WH 0005]CCQ68141.1 hypothetical protein CWATWH0402_86 [Crocosphaera watsonii WH 0402]
MINKNPDKLSEQIDTGVKTAIRKAIERHRRLGESISILKDGKVVTLTSDQIPQSSQIKTERARNQS